MEKSVEPIDEAAAIELARRLGKERRWDILGRMIEAFIEAYGGEEKFAADMKEQAKRWWESRA